MRTEIRISCFSRSASFSEIDATWRDDRPEQITLRASHTSGAAELHWYVDGNYHGRTTGDHAVSLLLEGGAHRVEVIDQDGRAASTTFTVERRS